MKAILFVLIACISMLLIACNNSDNGPVGTADQTNSFQGSGAAKTGPGSSGGNNNEIRVEGTVTAVDVAAGTVTIGSTLVRTNALTKIERNDVRVPLSSIRPGDRGQARIPIGSTIASKVESVG